MRNFILAVSSLICLIICPVFFLLGLFTFFEEPVLAFLQVFVAAPILLSLSIVFDYVREKLEDPEEDPKFRKNPARPNPSPGGKTEYRIPDLAGTPWAKHSDHQNES